MRAPPVPGQHHNSGHEFEPHSLQVLLHFSHHIWVAGSVMTNGQGIGDSGGETHAPTDNGSGLMEPAPLTDRSAAPRSRVTAVLPATPAAAPLPMAHVLDPKPSLSAAEAERARARIERLVAEARVATGEGAAALWFEAGRIHEHELSDPKSAAGLYQESHKADPTFLPVIHAARRLFAQLGKWGMCVVLIDEELGLPDAPVSALLVEKGRLLESRLSRPDDAVIQYRQALGADPGYAPALELLARHLHSSGQWQELVAILRAGAEAIRRPEQQLAWLLEAGRLCESKLADDEAAIAVYERAEAVVPDNRAVLESLRRLYGRQHDVERLGAVLERLAETASSPVEAVTFRCERARMLAGAGQEARAVEALEQAREDAELDSIVLGELARIYERLGMWSSLVETLEAHARGTRDRTELLMLFAEAGKLAEEKLKDPERAVRLYGSCVEVDVHYGPALAALGKLFARLGKNVELARVYAVQVEANSDPNQKVNFLFKLAEQLAERLGDTEGAIARLEELLAVRPGWVPALKMMATLFGKLENWEKVVATYERELAGLAEHGREHRDQTIFLLEKIAVTIEEKLGDGLRAAGVYRRVLQSQPGYLPAIRALGRLYARLELWEELVSVNREEAQLSPDQNHVVSLLHKNGEILADKIGRIDDAISAFRQALALMPNYLPTLMALGNIYMRTGRFHDLIAMHRDEAEVTKHPAQRAHVLHQIAQVFDENLEDPAAAMVAYRDVLAADPKYLPAMKAVARLASFAGDWRTLVEVYGQELAALDEARDRAQLRCRIAEIQDRRLGSPQAALESLGSAIAEVEDLLAAHEQRVAIFARIGDVEGECRAREAMHERLPDTDSRVANLRTLADHALYRLDQPERALGSVQRILSIVPLDRPALRFALGCALRLGNHRLAVEFAEKLARVEPAREEIANLHLNIAQWKELNLDPPEDALPNYIRALEYVPEHPVALRAVERIYVERQAWAALFALYERESQRQVRPEILADLHMKLGDLAERRLDKLDVAVGAFESALVARPEHLPAITRLKDLYARMGRSSDQLRMLTREAKTSKDEQHAIETLLEVGTIQRDKFGNVEVALQAFLDVLEREPLHGPAYQAVEAILVTESRWEELARVYMRRSGVVQEHNHKVELLTKAAHILGERLKRFAAAAEAYEGVIALVPNHTSALLQLGNIRFGLQDWDGAAKAYGQLVQVSSDPLLLVPVHEKLGIIYTEHLVDASKAIQHLASTLAMQPDNRDTRKRLARAYALAGSPGQALTSYKQLLGSTAEAAEKREVHLLMAGLYEEAFQDLAQATSQVEQAVALATDSAERRRLLDQVASLYERAGNLTGLVQATLSRAEDTAAADPGMAADLLFRAGQIQADGLNDAESAMRTVRRGLELAANNVELRAFLADLYARTPNKLLAIEEHRRIVRAGHVRPLSVRALFQLWQEAKNTDRAFVASELLAFLGAADASEEAFFNDNRKRVRKDSREVLQPQQFSAWVLHPAQRNAIHDVLVQIGADLGKLFGDGHLESVEKRLILKPKSDDPMRRAVDEVAHNLGLSGFDVHLNERARTAVTAHTAAPLVLAAGVDVLKLQPAREQRFVFGRELAAMMCGHTFIRGLSAKEFGAFLTAIGRAVDKGFPVLGESSDFDAMLKKASSGLSRKTRAALSEPLGVLARGRLDLQGFLDAAPLTEARAGLLLSGAFDAAVRTIAKEAQVQLASESAELARALEQDRRLVDLTGWALSDEHFQARQALRMAVEG